MSSEQNAFDNATYSWYDVATLSILTEENMDSKVTYLASRSLAVYEICLIEQYAETHKRMLRQQAVRVGAICAGFGLLATFVLTIPVMVYDLVLYLF